MLLYFSFLSLYPQVEWSEINAGLGQVMILLATLVDKTGFRFKHYQLLPFGSFSKLVKGAGEDKLLASSSNNSSTSSSPTASRSSVTTTSSSSGTKLNLYYEENFAFFPKRNLNVALQSFLQCVEVSETEGCMYVYVCVLKTGAHLPTYCIFFFIIILIFFTYLLRNLETLSNIRTPH